MEMFGHPMRRQLHYGVVLRIKSILKVVLALVIAGALLTYLVPVIGLGIVYNSYSEFIYSR